MALELDIWMLRPPDWAPEPVLGDLFHSEGFSNRKNPEGCSPPGPTVTLQPSPTLLPCRLGLLGTCLP